MKPYDFKWTNFYEANEQYFNSNQNIPLQLFDNELIICSTIIDDKRYSILTTKQLISMEDGTLKNAEIINVKDRGYGFFKDYNNQGGWTYGKVELADGDLLNYYIETGFASMVMIYGIRTVLQLTHSTQEEFDKKVKRLTNKKN